jgi:hypothetical protein
MLLTGEARFKAVVIPEAARSPAPGLHDPGHQDTQVLDDSLTTSNKHDQYLIKGKLVTEPVIAASSTGFRSSTQGMNCSKILLYT